tara:strand:+ start:7245 stop:7535 length:291 start_codon:yes stop_codon:yes gene_type:complete
MNNDDPSKNPLGLPTKKVKKWHTNKLTKKSDNWTPRVPMFCPCRDPETEKKCGNVMYNWDEMFYEQYGMCEKCYLKYNSHKEEIANEMKKQLIEKD